MNTLPVIIQLTEVSKMQEGFNERPMLVNISDIAFVHEFPLTVQTPIIGVPNNEMLCSQGNSCTKADVRDVHEHWTLIEPFLHLC